MARIDVDLDDALEKKFRQAINDRIGYRKGALKKAIVEAINLWLKKPSRKK